MGKRRLIKQNKVFISIIAVLFILFGFILYFGGNQIYEKEAKWQHGNTVARLLPGRRFVIAIHHSHPMLKAALQKLMFVSVILLASFLCLILIIGYLNIVRFRELIGAQKAIIFSLVELTERRDPETGRHLERTKNYTATLAEQLRK